MERGVGAGITRPAESSYPGRRLGDELEDGLGGASVVVVRGGGTLDGVVVRVDGEVGCVFEDGAQVQGRA